MGSRASNKRELRRICPRSYKSVNDIFISPNLLPNQRVSKEQAIVLPKNAAQFAICALEMVRVS